MATIVIACVISLALITAGSIVLGWSFGGAEIWIITLFVMLATVWVRKMFAPAKEGADKVKPRRPEV